MSSSSIPYGRQWIDQQDIDRVMDVLKGDYLTTGPAIPAFEEALCQSTGAKYAAAMNSGTSALHAAYAAAGVGPGSVVMTSPMTFAATGNAALYLGAKVRFADIDEATGNIDPGAVEALWSDDVRLLVPVDYAGHPAEYDSLVPFAHKHGAIVVSDGAHSLGATYRGAKVGNLADMTELSFHPVKPITTAEGGAVLTSNPDFARAVATFRTHGITRDPALLSRDEGPWYYEQVDLGFNYRMTDVQAALGASQIAKLDRFLTRRRAIAERYDEAFGSCPYFRIPGRSNHVESGWHLYVIRVQGNTNLRRPFFEALRKAGLGVQVHYLPVYLHPYYRDLGFKPGLCPRAEDFYARSVSLPIFPKMEDWEIDRVIETVLNVAREVLG